MSKTTVETKDDILGEECSPKLDNGKGNSNKDVDKDPRVEHYNYPASSQFQSSATNTLRISPAYGKYEADVVLEK